MMKKSHISDFDRQIQYHTKKGELFEIADRGSVICSACAHRCRIAEGKAGLCGVRFNERGALMVPSGYVSALCDDPIEKKPFYHLYPGMRVMSFGMIGCNFHCDFCQNWDISHGLTNDIGRDIQVITPKEICDIAESTQSKGIAATYNEPLITSEWTIEIFQEAKSRGFLSCCYVSNGHGTPEAIDYILPWVDSCNVDLKSFDKETYRKLGGKLEAVLETIKCIYEKKIWLEIVTLVVLGLNDSDEELRQMAAFIASVSPDIPWHLTAFHPAFKMRDRPATTSSAVLRAYNIGKEEGIHFIYPGNLPGQIGKREHTYCQDCGTQLIERYGFHVLANHVQGGCCYKCHAKIPGRWSV